MRLLVVGGLLLLGGLGYAQAYIEARQRQALPEKNTTLEPAGDATEPVEQPASPSPMRQLSPALEKAPSALAAQEETSPQPQHPSTERQLKPALEKAPFAPTAQEETSPQPQHSSTERQLKPALEKLTKPE